MKWVLLLRAVNVGGRNTLPMKDLKALLEDLGHHDVKTYLNSGNATFESKSRSAQKLATAIEAGLRERVGIDVRLCVRSTGNVKRALDELPELAGYVVLTFLFDKPEAAALQRMLESDWSPDTLVGNDQVLYITYAADLHSSKLTNARVEKLLAVSSTARTPATVRRLLG